MPNYDYRCTNCEITWEMQTTIADRDEPTKISCPGCEKEGTIERFIAGAPIFGREKGKTPEAFKDVLRHMKKKYLHNNINVD